MTEDFNIVIRMTLRYESLRNHMNVMADIDTALSSLPVSKDILDIGIYKVKEKRKGDDTSA